MRKETREVECTACGATGVYQGLAERDGLAVQCSQCRGTGKVTIEFTPFTKRRYKSGVEVVIESNPGYVLTPDIVGGGILYEEWEAADSKTGVFPSGVELRKWSCPAWWFQSNSGGDKPNWDECIGAGQQFSNCDYYKDKVKCWKRWDTETLAETSNVD